MFQSLPDVWAIDQLFPIMPIHRLTEAPTPPGHHRRHHLRLRRQDRPASSATAGIRKTLPVHPLLDGEPYYLGVFLVGAYQETLGDLHNLFGDTNVVSVRINEDGTFDFVREMSGDTVADVLSYVEYEPQQLLEQFRKTAEQAVRDGRVSVAERQAILEAFAASLRGYTYYED